MTLNQRRLLPSTSALAAFEAVVAAVLTSLMILLFLGSWPSTIIIATSIPLSILSSVICLHAVGQTINIMTLGGLALAVGILVDDATVMIEPGWPASTRWAATLCTASSVPGCTLNSSPLNRRR